MKDIKLKYLDSKNIFGTMNTGTINLRNITKDDKVMLMYKNDLKPTELIDITRMSFDEKTKMILEYLLEYLSNHLDLLLHNL